LETGITDRREKRTRAESASFGSALIAARLTGLFAVRQGEMVYVYVNACPHLGLSLDWAPDNFLSADGSLIVCANHGAEFRIADGTCQRGPCRGQSLEAVPAWINEGLIEVPADAGI
jgi:nitrite reductase/ring-hydroxylating ferredoxin subunit